MRPLHLKGGDKWNHEDDTRRWGEKEEDKERERRGERREKEEREREPHDFKPEYLGWSVTSDKRKAVKCVRGNSRMEGHGSHDDSG